MQRLTIDRSIWRCGQDSRFKHGETDTKLLDSDGMMCCLGQACLQLGFELSDLFLKVAPRKLEQPCYLTFYGKSIFGDIRWNDSTFADKAMAINDDTMLSRTGRELALYMLAKKHGIFVKFVGQYRD